MGVAKIIEYDSFALAINQTPSDSKRLIAGIDRLFLLAPIIVRHTYIIEEIGQVS
jgi:hypothetical protein